jgi:alkylated DNA repair dioxygenase AlkB
MQMLSPVQLLSQGDASIHRIGAKARSRKPVSAPLHKIDAAAAF